MKIDSKLFTDTLILRTINVLLDKYDTVCGKQYRFLFI